MSVTKPVKNQMAFWEKINDLGNVNGAVNIDVNISTVHMLTLTSNVSLTFTDITNIPDKSFVSLTILIIGNGTFTITFPGSCKSTSGMALQPLIPNTRLALQLFTVDNGVSWKVAPFATDF